MNKDTEVEWVKSSKTVHVYQNGSDWSEDQDQSYRGRTELRRNLLKTGDLKRDSGEYRCDVTRNGYVSVRNLSHPVAV
uniref:Ig-like domain-containing protein n=2 Tax=Oreochromis TaxID=8139 RepID=A0A669DE33_ORENI